MILGDPFSCSQCFSCFPLCPQPHTCCQSILARSIQPVSQYYLYWLNCDYKVKRLDLKFFLLYDHISHNAKRLMMTDSEHTSMSLDRIYTGSRFLNRYSFLLISLVFKFINVVNIILNISVKPCYLTFYLVGSERTKVTLCSLCQI